MLDNYGVLSWVKTRQQLAKVPCIPARVMECTLDGWRTQNERLLERVSAAKLCISCLQWYPRVHH